MGNRVVNIELLKAAKLLCVILLAMINFSYSYKLDGHVENDAAVYWETKLNGAQLLPSLRAMMTPLNVSEASKFTNNIASGAAGEYLQLHASLFCEAAHIQCALDGSTLNKNAEEAVFYTGRKERMGVSDSRPSKNTARDNAEIPIFYSYREGRSKNTDREDAEIPIFYSYREGRSKNTDRRDAEIPIFYSYREGRSKNTEHGNAEIPIFYSYREGRSKNTEHGNAEIPIFYSYREGRSKNINREDAEIPIFYSYREGRSKNTDRRDAEIPIFYSYREGRSKNTDRRDAEIPIFYSYREGRSMRVGENKNTEEISAYTDRLGAVNKKVEQHISTNFDLLTNVAFREREVLVKGMVFREDYGALAREDVDNSGRAFFPRNIGRFFSLDGQGASNVKQLGVSSQELQLVHDLCETTMDDEVRKCVNSIEDLVDFLVVELGVTPEAKITTYESITNAIHLQRHEGGDTFNVLNIKNLTGDSDSYVMCHDMSFPFRTFLCHHLPTNSKTFLVSLQGENGKIHERIALCHYHTRWDLSLPTYHKLGAEPGDDIEICHWLGGISVKLKAYLFVREATVAVS